VGRSCGTHWRGAKTVGYKFMVGKHEERDHLEDKGVDGRMGSRWILGRLAGVCELDSTGSG
jgi:hypothetical protein